MGRQRIVGFRPSWLGFVKETSFVRARAWAHLCLAYINGAVYQELLTIPDLDSFLWVTGV